MQKRGYCSHPQKKTRIVTEWKCVDIQYHSLISPEERARRSAECKKKDWYGVCELCRFFEPDADQSAAPTTTRVEVAVKPAEKPVYTVTDDLWLEDLN
jgi:hypothetical protein